MVVPRRRSVLSKKPPLRSGSTLSAEFVEGSDDLLTKILLALRAKPLFRFKLVCKRWSSIISSPLFSSEWKPKQISGLFVGRYWRIDNPNTRYNFISLSDDYLSKRKKICYLKSIDFIVDPSGAGVRILKSCGGLFLCCSRRVKRSEPFNFIDGFKYYVCNPTTKKFTVLPSPATINDEYGYYTTSCLAFDVSKSPHYKVILFRRSQGKETLIQTYSSEFKSWKMSKSGGDVAAEGSAFIKYHWGVFLDGCIFWPGEGESSVYYDVGKGNIHPWSMPPMPKRQYQIIGYFGELKGRLLLSKTERVQLKFIIYESAPDHNSWSVMYHVDLNQVGAFSITRLLLITEGGNDDDGGETLLIRPEEKSEVVSYNLKDSSRRSLCELVLRSRDDVSDDSSLHPKVHQFIENPFCNVMN